MLAVLGVAVLIGAGVDCNGPTRARILDTPGGAAVLGAVTQMAGLVFTGAIHFAGEVARTEARPLPERVSSALVLPDDLAARLRWRDDGGPAALRLWMRIAGIRAVTLEDTLVFRDASETGDLALWAHEIAHVEQYARWGTPGFARRYLACTAEVEQAATAAAGGFLR